jgi:hypothetical protein
MVDHKIKKSIKQASSLLIWLIFLPICQTKCLPHPHFAVSAAFFQIQLSGEDKKLKK